MTVQTAGITSEFKAVEGVLEPMTLDFDSMAQRTEKIYLFLRFIGQAKIPVGK